MGEVGAGRGRAERRVSRFFNFIFTCTILTAATHASRKLQDEQQIPNPKLQIANDKTPRVVSPGEAVDTSEVLLESLYVLQFVVVDRGVAEDADARCQFLHEVAHRLVLQVVAESEIPRLHKVVELTRWQLHLMISTPNASHAFTTFSP